MTAIVIVPAACQPPAIYTPLSEALSSLSTTIIPTPSVGASPGLKDFSADVALIRQSVMALADQGKDVVVLMHSYGGVPGSAALEGLGKTARVEKGEKGGVARLVYVCSFALREGERMPDAGNMEKLRQYDGLDEKAGTLLVNPPAAAYVLFHDLPKSSQEHYSSLLKPHSIGAMWSEQSYAAWQDIPSTYVVCDLDRVMPGEQQEAMIKAAQGVQPKAFDVVEHLESGHEPILSKPEELAAIVRRAAAMKEDW